MFRALRYFKYSAFLLVAALVLPFLAACRGRTFEEVRVTHDFVKEFYRSNSNLVLDYMRFDGSIKPFLGKGWSEVETDVNGDPYIWSLGEKSAIYFYAAEKKDLNFVIKCDALKAGRRQFIYIEVNGIQAATLSVDSIIRNHGFTIPGEYLKLGLNIITFSYEYSLTPKSLGMNNDERRLGVRFFSIDFNNSLDDRIFFDGMGGADIDRNAANVSRMSIDGDMKLVLMQMPKSALVYDKCYIPPDSELRFSLGFHPRVVEWTEDVKFTIFVKEYSPYSDDMGEEIFSVTLNPKKNEKDRSWRNCTVDLSDYAGKVLSFSFNVLADADPDDILCAWGEPKVYSRVGEPKYNVIFITMDALRRDHVGCYGYKEGVTPNVDSFEKEAVKYNNFYSVTTWTLPSFCSIYSSLYVQTHKARKIAEHEDISISSLSLLRDKVPTLPTFLKPYGYVTHVFTRHPYLYDKNFRISKDFDRISDNAFNIEKPFFLDEIEELLTDYSDERFFLHIHIVPPHDPYYAVSPYDDENLDYNFSRENPFKFYFSEHNSKSIGFKANLDLEMKKHVISLYDSGLMLSDEYFGKIIELIKEKGLYDDSLIIFSSDHGEQFWEHDGMFHSDIYNEILEIPLLIKYPESMKVPLEEVSEPLLTIDILPTILEVNEIPRPAYLQGRSLLRRGDSSDNIDKREYLFFSNASPDALESLIHKDYKYICNPGKGTEELYNITEDPREQKNIASEEPKILKNMRYCLSSYKEIVEGKSGRKIDRNLNKDVSIPQGKEKEAESPEVNDETLKRLRDLGYVE